MYILLNYFSPLLTSMYKVEPGKRKKKSKFKKFENLFSTTQKQSRKVREGCIIKNYYRVLIFFLLLTLLLSVSASSKYFTQCILINNKMQNYLRIYK